MPFLHFETHDKRATMSDTITDVRKGRRIPDDPSRDCLLVHAYMKNTPPLQPRRTLDQYFYDGIDTTLRDTDQVVYRYCEKHNIERKVFMVDQLWLWVLGKGKIRPIQLMALPKAHSVIRFSCDMLPRTLGSAEARSSQRPRWYH